MVVTKDIELPTDKELTVDEVRVSTCTLMTAAPYLGKLCEGINNEYILCRQELNDPRACIKIGKQVTACAIEVLKRIKKTCLDEFKQYANCIDKSSGNYVYRHCRKTQAVFDDCMKNTMCVERPDFGYFCRGRVHKTPRAPLPDPPCPCHPTVPDPVDTLPECDCGRKRARFGSRFYWMTE